MKNPIILQKISEFLLSDERVVFAYLFGSFLKKGGGNDIDIAVYCLPSVKENPFEFTSDIKIELSELMGLSPDNFDITLINYLLLDDRIDSLVMLGEIFDGLVLVDKNPNLRTDIIEKTSAQFRESASLLMEVYS